MIIIIYIYRELGAHHSDKYICPDIYIYIYSRAGCGLSMYLCSYTHTLGIYAWHKNTDIYRYTHCSATVGGGGGDGGDDMQSSSVMCM